MLKRLLALALLLLVAGCSAWNYEPVVDLRTPAQRESYDWDLMVCRNLAAREDPAWGAASGALLGAAVGGAVGVAVDDSYALGAAKAGAVAGAIGGTVNSYSGIHGIVKRCLEGRGYNVLQ